MTAESTWADEFYNAMGIVLGAEAAEKLGALIEAREAAAWCAAIEAAAEYADREEAYSSKRADTENHHDQVWYGSSAATAGSIASHVRALTPPADMAAALEAVRREERERMAGEVRCEAEAERDEFFNRLGRITSELGLPMDCTAGRIIEAIRDVVDDEREACASVSVKVEVPDGAEGWSPLEAWEEALLALDEEFRAAIRARGTEGGR